MLLCTIFKLNVNLLANVNLNNPRSRTIATTTIIAISLFSAATLLSLQGSILANAQNQNSTQSQTTKAKSTNASAPPIGNIQQLSKAVGNNSKILSSNAKIGINPNFTQPKMTAATPPNGLASNPKGKSSNSTSSGTSSNTMNKAAGNMSKAGGAAAGNMSKAGGAAAGNMSKAGGAAAGNMSKAGGAAAGNMSKAGGAAPQQRF
jgi:hypothetical protein